jgi:transposase
MQPDYEMPDSLWLRIATILQSVDPDAPANARAILNAIIYHAVTDTAWDALPAVYPPPTQVLAAVERWRPLGLFARLASALRLQLDE